MTGDDSGQAALYPNHFPYPTRCTARFFVLWWTIFLL